MKTYHYCIFGMLLACIIHVSIGCPRYGRDNVDVAKIHAGAKLAEEAFLAGDTKLLQEQLTSSALEHYKSLQPAITAEQMETFGEFFKNRKLEYCTHNFAVYSFPVTVNGETFTDTATFASQQDGSWKLVRF